MVYRPEIAVIVDLIYPHDLLMGGPEGEAAVDFTINGSGPMGVRTPDAQRATGGCGHYHPFFIPSAVLSGG